MGRSLKKGPFVAYHLLKKIDQMNKKFENDVWLADMTLTNKRLGFSCDYNLKQGITEFLNNSNYWKEIICSATLDSIL